MNTRNSVLKPAHALQVGDIVDISPIAMAFGYRYHQITVTPRPNGSKRFLDQVVLQLCVFGRPDLDDQEAANWNVHVHRDTPVRVLLKPPQRNESLPWR